MPTFYFDIKKNKTVKRKLLPNDKSFIHSYKFYPGIKYNISQYFTPLFILLHFKRILQQQKHYEKKFLKLDKLFSKRKQKKTLKYKRNYVDNNKDTIHKRRIKKRSPTKQPTCFSLYFFVSVKH